MPYLQVGIAMSALLLLPLIVDGLIQLCSSYESTNMKRLITGMMFGVFFVNLLLRLIRDYLL